MRLPHERAQGDIMKSLIGVLALAVVPTLAAAAEKPDWAFPVTEKVQPPPRFEANRVRPAPSGSALSITRAKADDMYDIPNWFPNMYPPMPAIVQYGNKERQVRACGSCHLPTGTGHDESAYVAGLPASYFIRQMADWKSGDRKFSPTMVTMAKVITDAEIGDAADYFASLKPRPWIRVVEADAVPKSYIGQGNKRLVHPDGGSEPLGNRIIEVPEDEEVVVYRDPMSGFVAYVPKGSIAKGQALASTGQRQDATVRHLPRPHVAGPGRRARHRGTPSQLHRSPALEHAERRARRHLGGADAAGGREAEQRRHPGDRGLRRIADAVTSATGAPLCRAELAQLHAETMQCDCGGNGRIRCWSSTTTSIRSARRRCASRSRRRARRPRSIC